MVKQEKISSPQSSTGIIRFYDSVTGGPKLDPKSVVVFSVVFIIMVKLITLVV
ncbi:MAG: preprotein translocase subunit Sec61beta [Candidatus Micrarchaeota archaeon]